jgi:hypothetical protein
MARDDRSCIGGCETEMVMAIPCRGGLLRAEVRILCSPATRSELLHCGITHQTRHTSIVLILKADKVK